MTALKKVLFAAAIVAAGYGAAAWCGPPIPVGLASNSAGGVSNPRTLAETQPSPANTFDTVPSLPSSLRLVPDTARNFGAEAQNVPPKMPALVADDPGEVASAVPAPAIHQAEPPDSISAVRTPMHAIAAPRAKLRDEAPRPLNAAARSGPASNTIAPISAGQPLAVRFNANGTGAQPATAQIDQTKTPLTPFSTQAVTPANADSQTFAATVIAPLPATSLTPLPSPTPANEIEPRMHIVVDGDSLAKLAGRYLDDPRRASEIYNLNRDLLSNPDMLPIGVELVIPPRDSREFAGDVPPQSQLPRAVAINSPYGSGLVPVRPIPASSALAPRARLAIPRRAD